MSKVSLEFEKTNFRSESISWDLTGYVWVVKFAILLFDALFVGDVDP